MANVRGKITEAQLDVSGMFMRVWGDDSPWRHKLVFGVRFE